MQIALRQLQACAAHLGHAMGPGTHDRQSAAGCQVHYRLDELQARQVAVGAQGSCQHMRRALLEKKPVEGPPGPRGAALASGPVSGDGSWEPVRNGAPAPASITSHLQAGRAASARHRCRGTKPRRIGGSQGCCILYTGGTGASIGRAPPLPTHSLKPEMGNWLHPRTNCLLPFSSGWMATK